MAVKFTAVKCPSCGANLPIEEGRTQMFCSYCGSSIIMTNENEHIYRHVDEAGIKQAETERIIRIKELELEERAENRSRKGRSIAFGIALFFVVIGVICVATGVYAGGGAIAIGGWIALFTFISGDESKKRNQDAKMARSGKIKLIGTATEYEKKIIGLFSLHIERWVLEMSVL